MARVTRRELKQDEFISGFEETLEFVEEQWEMILALVLVLLVGGAALGGLWWHVQRQERRASLALAQALEIYAAPVVANPAEALPGYLGLSYASEKEKLEAAEQEFTRLRQDFSDTSIAVTAKHYQALARWELGRGGEALAMLEEVSRAANPERAALAAFHLASWYEKLGRREDAIALYRKLADYPTASVPRPIALLALADLYAPTQPEEARSLYEEVKRALADTPVASQVERRLDLLPAAP